jgi:hypothetical protein
MVRNVKTREEQGARSGEQGARSWVQAASFLNTLTVQQALEHMRTYKPDVYIPAHHDADFNGLWRATEPLFQALKDENPNIITVSRGYREPVCFDTENNIAHKRAGSGQSEVARDMMM